MKIPLDQINFTKIITNFYDKVFDDVFIGYFFIGKNKSDLIAKQISFSRNLLGAKEPYQGIPLKVAHSSFFIRKAHFNRRHVLLKEALIEENVSATIIEEWLLREKKLVNLIIPPKPQ